MAILLIKLVAGEPKYYYAKSNNECYGITENGNRYRDKIFKTYFYMSVYIIHDGNNLISAGNASNPAN
jgi:hypothetical protein